MARRKVTPEDLNGIFDVRTHNIVQSSHHAFSVLSAGDLRLGLAFFEAKVRRVSRPQIPYGLDFGHRRGCKTSVVHVGDMRRQRMGLANDPGRHAQKEIESPIRNIHNHNHGHHLHHHHRHHHHHHHHHHARPKHYHTLSAQAHTHTV